MNIRNIAIIAHVDHGKTTLVDALFRQSGMFRSNQQVAERAMDSNDLEKERGITILAKCTSVVWNDVRINIVDTPGHADFGGEVERILSMVDGVVLLVDASEGAMPQTKFVLTKALSLGIKPIVVVNKVDRPDSRIDEVLEEIYDLFLMLEANDDQLNFKVLYASGRNGWASDSAAQKTEDLSILFNTILQEIPSPKVSDSSDFSLRVVTREYDSYLGRVLTGRVETGEVKVNMAVKVLSCKGDLLEQGRITKLLSFRGLERLPVESAQAGDIVAICGLEKASVSDTVGSITLENPLEARPIDPPTLAMTFSINNSPLAGKEGSKLTSRLLRDRLLKEAEGNVAIQIKETEDKDAFEVAGRGELQLGVLIETMRREGFELSISRPRVLLKEENGVKLEPMEEIVIDLDEEYVGPVVEALSNRKCEMVDMKPSGGGKTRITFIGPSRGLIGYHGQFLTDTRGTGIMSRLFHSYGPYKGAIEGRRSGVLISNGQGDSVAYALWNLEERGIMFIDSGTPVYAGMIIGEHNRPNDLEVNPLKAKQLSNVRASGKDEAIRLTSPKKFTLEAAITYIQDDERVEVTPKSIRLRKEVLDPNERKRSQRS